MERLVCKACGCHSMVPVEVRVEHEGGVLEAVEQESHLFACYVCGDNWLSVRATDDDGDVHTTHIHQMGMEPLLKRVAATDVRLDEADEPAVAWQYFMDEDETTPEAWRRKLGNRRQILRSICTN